MFGKLMNASFVTASLVCSSRFGMKMSNCGDLVYESLNLS